MTESLVKEEFKDWTELFNHTYEYDGFEGVLYELEDKLEYGKIIEKENGIWCITTGGWQHDEEMIESLLDLTSLFGHYHYLGYVRGGAYYFAEKAYELNYEIVPYLSDAESCNPKICQWCKYSTNGKRDAARSITMCDGCRYNQEFRMKGGLKQNDL